MSLLSWLDQRPAFICAFISVLLNLAIEIFSRHSILAGLEFMALNPLVFLYNAAIIMLTLSAMLVLKRRYFGILVVSGIWLILGVANFLLLFFRTTPLAAIDFFLLSWAELLGFETVLIAAIVLFLMEIAWLRVPVKQSASLAAVSALLAACLFIACLTPLLVEAGALSSNFGNLTEAYNDYGFVYCFSLSLVDRGINKPKGYSAENMARLLEMIGDHGATEPELKPNIIMVQLESFFDVKYMKGLSFSENPVPMFSMLKESYPHGFLTVPCFGAGTANTEFEILTGMNLAHFGAGEYPYKTVLLGGTTESLPYNLKELGYTSHAIHNNHGTFYRRHEVFSNLGFDTFTSLEYMSDVQRNPIGWAKDSMLTKEVMKALTTTPGQDFIYAISVQAHGEYPREAIDEKQRIAVSGIGSEEERIAFEYFVNQVYETDAFIGELIAELAVYTEPVVLVVFGDHLPSLGIENRDLSNGNRFETEYVIWSNFGLEAPSQNLSAYQLSAEVLKRLGIRNGVLTKLHQTLANHGNYQAALEMVEYDLIYGEHFALSDGPHMATELQMGLADITVTGIEHMSGVTFVYGGGFIEWSQVKVDGKREETTYLDEKTLMISGDLKPGSTLVVEQASRNTQLGKTPCFQVPK